MASITGRAPPMAVSGAAAATTMNTIPARLRWIHGVLTVRQTVLVLMVCSDMAALLCLFLLSPQAVWAEVPGGTSRGGVAVERTRPA